MIDFYTGRKVKPGKEWRAIENREIELTVLPGIFERLEIIPPKPLDTEHTVHAAKPKK